MTDIQRLLDEEANLKNSGKDAVHVEKLIRELRNPESPCCFGEDDCSSWMLSHCPWRMDCGVDLTINDAQAAAGGLSQKPLEY
jgi:hypothetical protein